MNCRCSRAAISMTWYKLEKVIKCLEILDLVFPGLWAKMMFPRVTVDSMQRKSCPIVWG